ncbi:hypothetical protein BDZ85DRAFT_260949 [Elsinoe ampelina]|uniref:Short-chain dehydrogenases/reductase n=1 Tax=Elsinoe ampelina TaxID=302913 RepID=A0A6A6GFE2_9PEZI|nr:hypothetical protein BDZ85DRAFT_260949 [Elsinoe ampelina]
MAAKALETVLVVGATGNIGVAAIQGALRSGRNVLAIVRNQASAKKLDEHVPDGHDRITTVEADIMSDKGVQGVVDQVRAGSLPAFQHVYTAAGNSYTDISVLKTTTEELKSVMHGNFEANFYAYRATIPYLLEKKTTPTSYTMCTGAQGEFGIRALPAISQGALFSMATAGMNELKGSNVRMNEHYLALRVEVDSSAEKTGAVKASKFANSYRQLLDRPDISDCRVSIETEKDIDELRYRKKVAA